MHRSKKKMSRARKRQIKDEDQDEQWLESLNILFDPYFSSHLYTGHLFYKSHGNNFDTLLSAGLNINIQRECYTLLHLATSSGDSELVHALIHPKNDCMSTTDDIHDADFSNCKYMTPEHPKYCFYKGAAGDIYVRRIKSHESASVIETRTWRYSLPSAAKFDIDSKDECGFTPLMVVILSLQTLESQQWYDYIYDLNITAKDLMQRYYTVFDILISHGADTNSRYPAGSSIPDTISGKLNSIYWQSFLSTPNISMTVFQRAVYHHLSPEIITSLVESGADVNVCDTNGLNVLHFAVLGFQTTCTWLIRKLLSCGLNINEADWNGYNALQHSIKGHHFSACIEMIESCGARLTSKDMESDCMWYDNQNFHEYTIFYSSGKNHWQKKLHSLALTDRIAFEYVTCDLCRQRLIEKTEQTKVDSSLQLPKLFKVCCNETKPESHSEIHGDYSSLFINVGVQDSCCAVHKRSICFMNDLQKVVAHLVCRPSYQTIDERNRNFIHSSLLLFTRLTPIASREVQMWKTNLKVIINLNAASVNNKDDQGRTPLHYAVILASAFPFFKPNPICNELLDEIGLVTRANVNLKDIYGRTPWHYVSYAVKGCGMRDLRWNALQKLHTCGGFPIIDEPDISGETPKYLEKGWKTFVHEINRRRQEYQFVVNHCQGMVKKFIHEGYKSNTIISISKSFVLPNKHLDFSAFLKNDYGAVSQEISHQLKTFMHILAESIETADPRLKGNPFPVGSAFEGTRTVVPNEFDWNVELLKFSEICEAFITPVCPAGYVHLRRKDIADAFCAANLSSFFDKTGNLLTTTLRFTFEKIINKVLAQKMFWDKVPFFELHLSHVPSLEFCDSNKICISLTLAINRPINGVHIFFPIYVDIVPSIYIEDFHQHDVPLDGTLQFTRCDLVFCQPQKLYPWIPISIPYVRISLATVESGIIRRSSGSVRAAYMFLKNLTYKDADSNLILDRNLQPLSFSSHILKTSVLYMLGSRARDKTMQASSRWSDDVGNKKRSVLKALENRKEIKHNLKKLTFCLLQFTIQDFVPSYFRPCHALNVFNQSVFLHHTLMEQYLRQHKNSWESNLTAKPFEGRSDELLMLNTMYFMMCEENEDRRLLMNLRTNPLFEYFRKNQLLKALLMES